MRVTQEKKTFNTTGLCVPTKHYMVNTTDKIAEIRRLVDAGKYFVINRARQYGKTTTLSLLAGDLSPENIVVRMDFQNLGSASFQTEDMFVRAFSRLILDQVEFRGLQLAKEHVDGFQALVNCPDGKAQLDELFRTIRRWCGTSEMPIVLMIDEVDSAANNQVFLDFFAQLRLAYLEREDYPNAGTFQSVILAGVTDIKHLRGKIREEDQHKVNSPWNIAADFKVDMSLSREGIQGMLEEYEKDHHTGMDVSAMAGLIRDYTSGYPYLVSRICQTIDEMVPDIIGSREGAWTKAGFNEAIKVILKEKNTLFDSLFGKLINYPDIKECLRRILMEGEQVSFNLDNNAILQMRDYGFIKEEAGKIAVANRIFETRLYNYFLTEEELGDNQIYREGSLAKNMFVKDGVLDVRLILERFVVTYDQIFGPLKDRFPEKDGRELFLLYLRPIINGTGNYYIETQTRDQTRTDVIVDYLGKQYVIEMKVWRGSRYNEEGEAQLKGYLDYYHLDEGYMLSFNFNQKKEVGVKCVQVGDKVVYEATL